MSTATPTPAGVGLDTALTAALRWLYATIQPSAALVERRGALLAAAGRTLRIVPIAGTGTPLIVVDMSETARGGSRLLLNTLPHDELPAVRTELARLGIPVSAHHYHAVTGTITLDVPAHPSLRAAVHRLDGGCPRHHGRRCHETVGDGEDSCTWHTDGRRATIWPQIGAQGAP